MHRCSITFGNNTFHANLIGITARNVTIQFTQEQYNILTNNYVGWGVFLDLENMLTFNVGRIIGLDDRRRQITFERV